jgi:hypothetical protein
LVPKKNEVYLSFNLWCPITIVHDRPVSDQPPEPDPDDVAEAPSDPRDPPADPDEPLNPA